MRKLLGLRGVEDGTCLSLKIRGAEPGKSVPLRIMPFTASMFFPRLPRQYFRAPLQPHPSADGDGGGGGVSASPLS